jgi:UDP-GlcNAc:undecaprenyl-phosphate/decaprenyl-phosphate GlcNAc-1-phosphate transferase
MQYLIILFAALVGTVFITPYYISLLNKVNVIDLPDGKRKLHSSPVPRMGGFLIFLIVTTSLFIFYGDLTSIKFFLFGSTVIVTIGAYDDLLGASWYTKFVYQTLSAILLLLVIMPQISTLTLFGIEFPFIPAAIILMIFVVGTINSFNLLDGLDGLVSGITLLVSALLFFISLNQLDIFLLVLLSTLIGCLVGFLKYNAFPARIFLGDSGSFLLGFYIVGAVLLIPVDHTTKNLDLTFPVFLLAVPIIDTLKVLSERLLSGRHPFLADRKHIHHIVFSKNITHKTTVFIITIYSLLFAANAIYYRYYNEIGGIIFFFVLLIPLVFANKMLTFIINSEKLLTYGRAVNRFPQVIINYYKTAVLPAVSLLTAILIIYLQIAGTNLRAEFLIPSLIILGSLLIFTILNYRKSKHFTDIIVFFNILIFFVINLSNPLLYRDIAEVPLIGNINFHLLIIALLLPTVGFFLLFRDRIQQNREMYLSGLDLAIILLVVLLSLTSRLIPISNSYIIPDTLFRSFLIYLFYKIVIQIKPKFRLTLYAFSFLMVLLSQTIILIS